MERKCAKCENIISRPKVWCKNCWSSYNRLYRKENKEYFKKWHQKYRLINRKKLIENTKQWDLKHKEHKKNYLKSFPRRLAARKYLEKNRKLINEKNLQRLNDAKEKVYDHYGKYCHCCGEKEPKFLSIDHINGGGTKHRKSLSPAYRSGKGFSVWLVKNNFPKGYQILCMNCNHAKGHYEKCPHTD